MPAKNAAKWIEETIDSIRNQSFDDWELLCIDDHSDDNTFDLVDQLADGRIKVIRNHQKGIIPALQLGLDMTNGLYVTRMDADDIMPIDRLKLFNERIGISESKTIITGKVKYFPFEKVSDGYLKYEKWLNELCKNDNHWDHIYRECVIASPNWITRRADLIENGIFKNLEYPEDYSMCFQWMNAGFRIDSIDDTTLLWREHPERTSRNSDRYDQKSFFKLKSEEFLRSHRNQSIGILGVNQKSKEFVKHSKGKSILKWHDIQSSNYQTPISDIQIESIENIDSDVIAICVYPPDIQQLVSFLNNKGYTIGENAWFF